MRIGHTLAGSDFCAAEGRRPATTSRSPAPWQGFSGHGCAVVNRIRPGGTRALAIHFDRLEDGATARATTSTFVDSIETAKYFERRGYGLMTSPMLSPGQTVTAAVELAQNADEAVDVAICIRVYDAEDKLLTLRNPATTLEPGASAALDVDDSRSRRLSDRRGGNRDRDRARPAARSILDRLHWQGAPNVTLSRIPGSMWNRAWVNGVDQYHPALSRVVPSGSQPRHRAAAARRTGLGRLSGRRGRDAALGTPRWHRRPAYKACAATTPWC